MSTARCYLDPIRNRHNLHIETGALTEALVLDGKRCTGVRYSIGGDLREARAARAKSWSAPARSIRRNCSSCPVLASPNVCAISGIDVRHALPGVGENLRDHYAPRTRWLVGEEGRHLQRPGPGGLGMVCWHQATRYALFRKGFLASVRRALMRALRVFARGSGGARPAARLGANADRTSARKACGFPCQSGFTCYAHPMRPESKGHIHIAAADPRRPPAINFNFSCHRHPMPS